MSMQDPISDMLTRIRNAGMAGKTDVSIPASKMKQAIAGVLKEEGYISDFKTAGEGVEKNLIVKIKYHQQESVIEGIKRVSKPSCRVYCGSQEVPRVRNGLGIAILSTPQGVVSNNTAKKQQVGGEILCEVW